MEDRDPGRPRPREIEVPGLSPVRAFFVVCALATVVGGGLFATRDASPSEPPRGPAASPDYSLTDAEAIAEFERLRSTAFAAVRNRDVSLVDEVFTSDGPLYKRALTEIQALLEKKVFDRSTFTRLETVVTENAETRFAVTERGRLDPCFVTASGRDVSTGPATVVQVAQWTVHLENGEWLLHNAEIVSDRAVSRRGAACD